MAAGQALTPARAWWHATRPATLAASVSPVLVGVSIALRDGRTNPSAALAALLVAVALQVGVNYANDYSDFKKGADGPTRIGPPRAASSGVVPPGQVKAGALAAFGLAAVIGLFLSLAVDPRLLLVGAGAIAAGWLYTGGPRPYGYMGLGEVFVFVFFGLVATAGTVYVEEHRLTALAVLGGIAMGAFATAILILNNIRDIDTDAVAGKRTLAVRLGRSRTRVLLAAVLAFAFLAPVLAVASGRSGPLLLVTLLATPGLVVLARASGQTGGPPLVAALKNAARLQVAFALLWTLGMLLS
jgi:1,4-dihydroxy-2-naphthoate octaprenyltransferase